MTANWLGRRGLQASASLCTRSGSGWPGGSTNGSVDNRVDKSPGMTFSLNQKLILILGFNCRDSGRPTEVRLPPAKAQPHRQKTRLAWDQRNELLGRRAAIQRLSPHQYRLEGARIAPSETIGAGVSQQILDKRTQPTVGFCPVAIPRASRFRRHPVLMAPGLWFRRVAPS
jgi:hypothetical protein